VVIEKLLNGCYKNFSNWLLINISKGDFKLFVKYSVMEVNDGLVKIKG